MAYYILISVFVCYKYAKMCPGIEGRGNNEKERDIVKKWEDEV